MQIENFMLYIKRNTLLRANQIVFNKIIGVSCILSIFGFLFYENSNNNPLFLFQIFWPIICIISYYLVNKYIKNNNGFNFNIILLTSDLTALIYLLFLTLFTISFNSYMLFVDFDWKSLVLVVFSTFFTMVLFNNFVSFNLIAGYLTLLSDEDEIAVKEDDWFYFLHRNQLLRMKY